MGSFVDLDSPGLALAGETARDVHGIAPQVVDEFLRADHAGDDRTRCDANAQLQRLAFQREFPSCYLAHGECKFGDRGAVPGLARDQTAGHHVRIAYGLDLLQPEVFGSGIERRKQAIEQRKYLRRLEYAGYPGEIHDVRKHHRDLREAVGNR
jgi:hypothetical protein